MVNGSFSCYRHLKLTHTGLWILLSSWLVSVVTLSSGRS